METPSSARRIARSHAAVASANSQIQCKQDDSWHRARCNNGGERPALLDVTNESPVVGLASGGFLQAEKTLSAASAKSLVLAGRGTPGSGEELLRGQVRTLLQKVEEESEHPTVALGQLHRRPPPPLFPALLGIVKSPLELLAPTPANTPQIPGDGDFVPMEATIASSRILSQNDRRECQIKRAEDILIVEECQLNRALTFESPEKWDVSDNLFTISSSLTYECGSNCTEKYREDDNSSVWSTQVNVSTNSDSDDEDVEEGDEGNEEESLDSLCEGLKKVRSEDENQRLPEFAGKHTKFVYNSDDEIEGEEAVGEWKAVSPSVVVLKGLPVPEGKHLRFLDENEEE